MVSVMTSANLQSRTSLKRFAWLSIAAAITTIGLKSFAYGLTGSVGLLSDALESLVNLVGALMALAMLTIAARPEDEEHAHGHTKAEYFSSGVEGTLILIAALSIGVAAFQRLLDPKPIEQIGLGLGVSLVASLINLAVALAIRKAGREHHSITLEANARHLMTDVWTSGGVLVGVGAVGLTGWERLDPIVALVVAANIVWSGFGIIKESVAGLMDTSIPSEDMQKLLAALAPYREDGVDYHALRTRRAGAQSFISLHVFVPGMWTVHHGHEVVVRIEEDIRRVLPNASVITHMDSREEQPVAVNDARPREMKKRTKEKKGTKGKKGTTQGSSR
jgi:cation diffusion facilitator family transporter